MMGVPCSWENQLFFSFERVLRHMLWEMKNLECWVRGWNGPSCSCRRIWGHTRCSSTEWAMGKTVMANCVLGWMFYLLQSWWILLRVWGTVRQSSGEKFNQTFFGFPWTAYHFPFSLNYCHFIIYSQLCFKAMNIWALSSLWHGEIIEHGPYAI